MRISSLLKAVFGVLIVLIGIVFWTQYQLQGNRSHDPVVAPAFRLPLISGGIIDLTEMRGIVVVVNYWASWCSPCQAEFSSMIELAEKFRGRPFKIIAISLDEENVAVINFLKKYSPLPENLLIALDPEKTSAAKYGTNKLPESYILDSNLRIVKKVVSAHDWMELQTVRALERLLKGESFNLY